MARIFLEGPSHCHIPLVPSGEMSLPLPTTLSPSKISAFKHCPLQFRFSVIDRLPEPPSPAASKGTLVHRALELLMVRPPADRTPAAALADLERARHELADHPEFAGLEPRPPSSSTPSTPTPGPWCSATSRSKTRPPSGPSGWSCGSA